MNSHKEKFSSSSHCQFSQLLTAKALLDLNTDESAEQLDATITKHFPAAQLLVLLTACTTTKQASETCHPQFTSAWHQICPPQLNNCLKAALLGNAEL